MELYKNEEVSIYFDARQKVLVCYDGDDFCQVLPYHKPVRTLFQLKDDARMWYEEWINGKPKPMITVAK